MATTIHAHSTQVGGQRQSASFAAIADILSRVVKMLGRPLTPEEVSDAIDAAFSARPNQADMSALVATFSTPLGQPRDAQGRYQPHASATGDSGRAITPERRTALLNATTAGRAVLAAQEKEAQDQQKAYPQPGTTDAAGHQALAGMPHGQDVLANEAAQAKKAPWMTPTGHVVNHMTPVAYKRMLELTGDGREMLRQDEAIMRDKGWPFARSIHAGATADSRG